MSDGGLLLPRCPACRAFHYPKRVVCPFCTHVPEGPMPLAAAPADGVVAAATTLHTTLDPAFADRLPVHLVSVTLAAGPTAICFAAGPLQRGDAVAVSRGEDALGRPVLTATPVAADPPPSP